MAVHQPIDGVLAFQKETSFAASSSETVRLWTGKLSATVDVQHGRGQNHTSIWGHQVQNDRFGTWYMGRIEWQLTPNEILKDILDSVFDTKSIQASTPSAGYTTITYRPKRIGDLGSFKIGYEFQPDGPNYSFEGCVLTRLAIRGELRQYARISMNFVAAVRTEFANSEQSSYSLVTIGQQNNFESQYVEGAGLPSTSGLSVGASSSEEGGVGPHDIAVEWDDVVNDMIQSVNVHFGHDHDPAKYSKTGVVSRFRPRSNFEVGFGLTRLIDEDDTLFEDAIDKSQHKLELEFAEASDNTKKLKITWPKTEIRNQDMPILQSHQDRPSTLSLVGIQDANLNTGSEPEIVLVKTA